MKISAKFKFGIVQSCDFCFFPNRENYNFNQDEAVAKINNNFIIIDSSND